MAGRTEVSHVSPGSIGTDMARVAPIAAVWSPNSGVAPVTIWAPEANMIDVAAVRSNPILVIPTRVVEVVDVRRIVMDVVEPVDEILVPFGNIAMAAGRPTFTRAALSRSRPGNTFACASLSWPSCVRKPLARATCARSGRRSEAR